MYLHKIGFTFSLVFSFLFSVAQSNLRGKVLDNKDKNPLMAANVVAFPITDSTQKQGALTDQNGNFNIEVKAGLTYKIRVSFIGYETLEKTVLAKTGPVETGVYQLKTDEFTLKTAVVEKKIPPVTQKTDTTEFNSRSYKVNPDATAEDLVKKMPGITQENGTIKAQGEEVKKVFVDGREFFGDDAATALKNLPAEMIDKVQVFDRMSDQSRFTGFDDGNSQKSINIITKSGMSSGLFGKVYGGYGTDDHYESGIVYNYFKGARRFSILGMSNNVNQQNFSSQDLLGVFGNTGQSRFGGHGPGRPGGSRPGSSSSDASSFLTGQQTGFNTTHALGLNYSDMFHKKTQIQASYFFNQSDNTFNNQLNRLYFVSDGTGQNYSELTDRLTTNLNHRANLRLESNPDSMNNIVFNYKFSFQNSELTNILDGITSLSGSLLSQSLTQNNSVGDASNQQGSILWNRKLGKIGRTLSLQGNYEYNQQLSDAYLDAYNYYTTDTIILNQKNDQDGLSHNGSLMLSYTEPIGTKNQLQITYQPSVLWNNNDRYTNEKDSSGEYSMTDTLLSSAFENQTQTQNLGFQVQRKNEKITFSLGLNLQQVDLEAIPFFPASAGINRIFRNILPSGRFMYQISPSKSWRAFSRGFTQTPRLSQLQNVLNNTNPLQLSIGNPNLRQQTSYFIGSRYNSTQATTMRSFQSFVHFSYTVDYIGSSTYLSQSDSTVVNGISLPTGTQLTVPVNLQGYMAGRTFVSYALPLNFIKSNLNLNTGFNYSNVPGLINEKLNRASTYGLSVGFLLGSNVSQNLDFSLGYTVNQNWVSNTIQPQADNSYLVGNGYIKFNWMPWKGLVVTSDLNQNLYNGLNTGFNQQVWLWNAGLGYKFMKNKQAELRLIAFDVLNQNRSINRVVTDAYLEDTRTTVLQQYFMLTFVFQIRKFNTEPKKVKPF